MPSMLHEALLLLFRNRPSLAPELLRDVLDVSLPRFTEVRIEDTALTQVVPTEYHADFVVLLHDGKPVFSIIVEAQLSIDEEKRFTWPIYAMAQRARRRTPVCVLVVTPDPVVAKWAAKPIDIGQPGSPFRPLVLGPGAVPYVTNIEKARNAPELAVLSTLAHGQEPEGVKIAFVAAGVTSGLDEERAKFYYDLVLSSLNEATRKTLEDLMASGHYEYQSDFAKKYVAEGEAIGNARVAEAEARGEARVAMAKAEAKAEVLLKIFAGRGFPISEAQRVKLIACKDIVVLDRWIDRAFEASSVGDVLG